MALKGLLKDLSVADLVKIHCFGRARACVRLSHNSGNAELFFDGGNIIDAQFDTLAGIDAVYKALALDDGNYKVELNASPVKRTVQADWKEILKGWEHAC